MTESSEVGGGGRLRIAFVGYGNVGFAVATAALAAGHEVVFAQRDDRPEGALEAVQRLGGAPSAQVAPAADAVASSDVVILAVPFGSLGEVLPPLAGALAGKVVIDATNPVGPGLTHGLGSQRSGAEHVTELVPGARIVKAFNVYGAENLASPPSGPAGLRGVMPLAGDDPAAKAQVAELAASLGWEPLDVGPLAAAVDLEHLTLLWVRLVRGQGHPPRLVWAALGDRAGADS